MSLLNSQYCNFEVSFPRTFFYKDLEAKYDPIFKKLPIPYKNVTDYMNYTIQSISWPAISVETVTQTSPIKLREMRNKERDGRINKKEYIGGFDLTLSTSNDFNITFRTTESFLNYWIMYEQLEMFLGYCNENTSNVTMGDIELRLLDNYGHLIMTKLYSDVIYTGISELELSYSNNVPEFKTFTCDFKHNGVKIKQEEQ